MTAALRAAGGVRATFRKLLALIAASARQRLQLLGEVLVRAGFLVVIMLLFSELWRTVQLRLSPRPGGYTLQQLIWYLAFAEAIIFTTPGNSELPLDRDLRSGEIAYRIAHPLAFPLYYFGMALGDRLVRFAFNLCFALLIASVLVGTIVWRPTAMLAALGCGLLAAVIDELIALGISLSSLFFENSYGLHLLYRRGALLLGGALIPLAAYPEWLARICRALPFQYLVAQPAALFVSASASGWFELVTVQLELAAAFAALAFGLYALGLRHVAAQGG